MDIIQNVFSYWQPSSMHDSPECFFLKTSHVWNMTELSSQYSHACSDTPHSAIAMFAHYNFPSQLAKVCMQVEEKVSYCEICHVSTTASNTRRHSARR